MQNLRTQVPELLRRSGAFFKIDIAYLAKGGSWMTLGQVINMLVAFSISIAFANLFPKESFGIYKFILSTAGIIGILSFVDMGTAVTQAVARGFGNSLSQGFRANLKWSLGTVLAGFALCAYYYAHGNMTLSYSFLIAGILMPLTASASLWGAYLSGKKDFKRSTIYGIIRNVAPAAALIGTILVTQSLAILITVYFLSATLVSLFLYHMAKSSYAGENDKEDPKLVSYGKHLGVMGVLGQVAGNLDKILLFHYFGAASLATYAFAIAPVEQLQGGKKMLNALILPKLSRRPFADLQKAAPRRVWMLALYAAILVGIYVPLVPYFYQFFYPQYLDAVLYSQIYSLTLFGVIGSVLDTNLVAHKKKKELYVSRTLHPIIKIILCFLLIPPFGIMGLVLIQIIVRAVSGFLAYYFVANPFRDAASS